MVYLSENGKALISIFLLELDKLTYPMLHAKYQDYLSENGKALISIFLLELDKLTYLMLHAKYHDKLNTSTEYYTS